MENEQSQQTEQQQAVQEQQAHRIGRIIQVMIARHNFSAHQLESRFRVQLRCNCCLNQVVVCTRSQLISIYALSENKVRQIELIALRQQKLRETKQNSDELMGFLGFDDVEDFSCPSEDAFIDYTRFGSSSPHKIVNILTVSTSSMNTQDDCINTPLKGRSKNPQVGEKRVLSQREMTCEDLQSPTLQNFTISHVNDDAVTSDAKRMQLLESNVLSNFESTKLENLRCDSEQLANLKSDSLVHKHSQSSNMADEEESKENMQLLNSKSQNEYSYDSDESQSSPNSKGQQSSASYKLEGFQMNVEKMFFEGQFEKNHFQPSSNKRQQKLNSKQLQHPNKFLTSLNNDSIKRQSQQKRVKVGDRKEIFLVTRPQLPTLNTQSGIFYQAPSSHILTQFGANSKQ
eukprot:403372051